MAGMIALTFTQVLCRFVLNFAIQGTEQSIRLCFVWIIFLGAAIAVKEGSHLVLEMLTSQLPEGPRKVLRVIVLLGTMVCAGVLLYASGQYCLRCVGKSMLSLSLPANAAYIAMPISGALMLFYQLEILINLLRKPKKGDVQ